MQNSKFKILKKFKCMIFFCHTKSQGNLRAHNHKLSTQKIALTPTLNKYGYRTSQNKFLIKNCYSEKTRHYLNVNVIFC